MSKTRRHFTPEQKAEIVRRHVVGKEPVSNLADEFGLQPRFPISCHVLRRPDITALGQ